MTVRVCLCDHSSPPTPLPGPGISSSMSFEEEEEEEEENSSSSSQLNSNTRPSSATSRKSTRVSEELLLSRRADSSVAQVGGERSEVRQSWLSWAMGWAQVPVKSFFPWSSSVLPVFSQARGRGLWSWTARLLRACLFPPSPPWGAELKEGLGSQLLAQGQDLCAHIPGCQPCLPPPPYGGSFGFQTTSFSLGSLPGPQAPPLSLEGGSLGPQPHSPRAIGGC